MSRDQAPCCCFITQLLVGHKARKVRDRVDVIDRGLFRAKHVRGRIPRLSIHGSSQPTTIGFIVHCNEPVTASCFRETAAE